MRIVPVLDLMNGQVVRGVGGHRHEYRPLVSRLTPSCRPLDIARAFRSHFGRDEIYVADLDAIVGGEPAWTMYDALRQDGFRLWVDAGVRRTARVCQLAETGIENIIAGLETVAGPDELAEMARMFGERLVFSLDLRQGDPLGNRDAWENADAATIAAQAIALGVRRLLILDLARVGVGDGTGTGELCARLCAAFPQVEVSTGGGVRHRGDLEQLRACGVRVALVSSALHDGRLTPALLEHLYYGGAKDPHQPEA